MNRPILYVPISNPTQNDIEYLPILNLTMDEIDWDLQYTFNERKPNGYT